MQEFSTLTPENVRRRIDYLLQNGYDFTIKDLIERGFDLCKGHYEHLIGFAFLTGVVASLADKLSKWGAEDEENMLFYLFGSLLFSTLNVVMYGGYFIYFHKVARGAEVSFNHFFEIFRIGGKVFVVQLLYGLIILAGVVFLILPGFYLAIGAIIAFPLVIFTSLTPWEAIKASLKIIRLRWWSVLGLYLTLVGLNIIGLLCLIVGVFVTYSVTMAVCYLFFADLFLTPSEDDELSEIGA